MNPFSFLLFSLLISVGVSVVTASLMIRSYQPSQEELISTFYETENAVHVSPHSIRKSIAKQEGNFILVDLRSAEEYEKEHIMGAVNIPAYKDPDTSAYDEVDRIVESFRQLDSGKDIIVYCYSIPCMTGRKVGKMLTEHGTFVKHLGIGWNEWRYFWTLWNHEHEWTEADVKEYVASGKEPGNFRGMQPPDGACSAQGDFGC